MKQAMNGKRPELKKVRAFINLILVTMMCTGCSKNQSSDSLHADEEFIEAGAALNDRNYEAAIQKLERLLIKEPNSPSVKIRLMHAYAGASGFESVNFSLLLKDIVARMGNKPFQNTKSELNEYQRNELRGGSITRIDLQRFRKTQITKDILYILESVPRPSTTQQNRLNQALNIYTELGLTPTTASDEENFKWGILFSYRLILSIKEQIIFLDHGLKTSGGETWSTHKARITFLINQMFYDAKMAYLLFSHSYAKLREITIAADTFLNRATDGKFRSDMITQAHEASETIEYFLKSNKEFTGFLVSELERNFENSNLNEILDGLQSERKELEPELSYRQQRVRAIVRVFLEKIEASQSENIQEGNLLTKEVWAELKPAIKSLIETGEIDSLQTLLNSKNSKLARLKEIGRLLVNDPSTKDLAIKPELEGLLEQVDREQIKLFLKSAKAVTEDSRVLSKNLLKQLVPELEILEQKLEKRGKTVKSLLDAQLYREWIDLKNTLKFNGGKVGQIPLFKETN